MRASRFVSPATRVAVTLSRTWAQIGLSRDKHGPSTGAAVFPSGAIPLAA
jgi:hypothetical protein